MKKLLPLLLLVACDAKEITQRQNYAIQAVLTVKPTAKCNSVYIAYTETLIPDTANCVIGDDVLFCKANAQNAVACQQIGKRDKAKAEEETK